MWRNLKTSSVSQSALIALADKNEALGPSAFHYTTADHNCTPQHAKLLEKGSSI